MDFTPFFQALIALLGTLITAYAIPYIRSKTTAQQQERIDRLVMIAVTAIEQIYRNSEGMGNEKKKAVQEFLAARGITIDADVLDSMIEAAVYRLTNNGLLMETIVEEDGEHGFSGA